MGLVEQVNKQIGQRISEGIDASLKVVPCTIVTVDTDGDVTIQLQGSTDAHPARLIAGQAASVGQQAYALWDPGVVNPLVFRASSAPAIADSAFFPLTLPSGVTGSVFYSVTGGMIYLDISATFASTAVGGVRTIVAAGVLPAWARPTGPRHCGHFAIATVQGRVEVLADGTVNCIPLSGAATGAVGFGTYPAGK